MQDCHEGQRVKLCVINTNMTSLLADQDFLLRWGGGERVKMFQIEIIFFDLLGQGGGLYLVIKIIFTRF